MKNQPLNPQIHRAVQRWNSALTDMRQDYESAKETRFVERPSGMFTLGSGADYSFRDETSYFYLLGIARHIEENDPVVPQGVRRAVNNIVQGGFQYEPDTGEDRIDRQLKERWDAFADDGNADGVDWDQEHNWHEYETMVARRMIVDGDLLIEPMNTGQLRMYESHRMRSPTLISSLGTNRQRNSIRLGVELAGPTSRRRVRYWVTKQEFDGFGRFRFRQTDMRGISARDREGELNAFHVYHPKRFSATRGVTALAPAASTVGMHNDIHFAKLVQQQMASYVGFTHEVPMGTPDYEPPPAEDEVVDPATGKSRMYGPDMSPGSDHWPHYAGERIVPFTANIPNAEWFDQAKLALSFIAVNLDLPLIVFMLDASETNFSGWRGAMDQAKIGFMKFQRLLAAKLHKRVVRFQQRRWILQDRGLASAAASMGADFWRHTWGFPRWPYVEPLKDVQADANEIAAVLNSPRRVVARKNLRWETIAQESVDDTALLVKQALTKAKELNEEFSKVIKDDPGERVRWRDLAYSPLPRQMQIIDPESTAVARESQESPEESESASNQQPANRE